MKETFMLLLVTLTISADAQVKCDTDLESYLNSLFVFKDSGRLLGRGQSWEFESAEGVLVLSKSKDIGMASMGIESYIGCSMFTLLAKTKSYDSGTVNLDVIAKGANWDYTDDLKKELGPTYENVTFYPIDSGYSGSWSFLGITFCEESSRFRILLFTEDLQGYELELDVVDILPLENFNCAKRVYAETMAYLEGWSSTDAIKEMLTKVLPDYLTSGYENQIFSYTGRNFKFLFKGEMMVTFDDQGIDTLGIVHNLAIKEKYDSFFEFYQKEGLFGVREYKENRNISNFALGEGLETIEPGSFDYLRGEWDVHQFMESEFSQVNRKDFAYRLQFEDDHFIQRSNSYTGAGDDGVVHPWHDLRDYVYLFETIWYVKKVSDSRLELTRVQDGDNPKTKIILRKV